jgi:hypothetical protein
MKSSSFLSRVAMVAVAALVAFPVFDAMGKSSSFKSSKSSGKGWGSSSKSSSTPANKPASGGWGSSSKPAQPAAPAPAQPATPAPATPTVTKQAIAGAAVGVAAGTTVAATHESESSAATTVSKPPASGGWGSSSKSPGNTATVAPSQSSGTPALPGTVASVKAPTLGVVDQKLTTSVGQSGKKYSSRQAAAADMAEKAASTTYASEPPTRPAYVPPKYSSGGRTYVTVFNGGRYGYYNDANLFIPYIAANMIVNDSVMRSQGYVYPTTRIDGTKIIAVMMIGIILLAAILIFVFNK